MKFEMYKQEKNIILGLLVCALITVFGYSLAYFVSGVKITGSGGSASGSTAKLPTVTYDAGDEGLTLSNAYPGKSETKTFQVKFDSKDNVGASEKIGIKLNIESNEFKLCNAVDSANKNGCDESDTTSQLELKISGGGIDGEQIIDLTGKTGQSISLATDTISADATYTVTVEFKETDKNQGHNAGKNFSGSITVEFVE